MSRTLVLWCPDWPVVAAGIVDGVPAYAPVAVLSANRVIACSAAARREGIRRGLRKRETQARCPEIVTIEHDEGRLGALDRGDASLDLARVCVGVAELLAGRRHGGEPITGR